jgi:penicillin-binding protein 2
LFYRQIIQNSHFSQKSRQQSVRRIIIPAVRGNICDRNGNVLVCNCPLFSLDLHLDELDGEFREEFLKRTEQYYESGKKFDRNSARLEAYEFVVNKLLHLAGKILGKDIHLSGKRISNHIEQHTLSPMIVLNDLSVEEYDMLINFLPPNSPLRVGLGATRYYPNGPLACHILGYTVLEENQSYSQKYGDRIRAFAIREQIGKSGVEKCANDMLSGEPGYEAWVVNPSGTKSSLYGKIEPQNGQLVHLSIDKDLQAATEKVLAGYSGSAIVMDVNSGEILAMANFPAYDPNLLYPSISNEIFNQISESGGWFNQSIQGLFPMGSVFKLISAIAFIKSGEIDIEEKVLCTGTYSHGNRRLKCNNHAHGEYINLKLALGKSCNVYMFDRAAKIGHEAMSREAKNFGLDAKSKIELPYGTTGMVIPDANWKLERYLENWWLGDTLNLSIGQGYVLTTPLNVCCFTASLAKNRYQTKPTIFRTDGKISEDPRECLSAEGHKILVDAMVDCVNNYTGRRAKIDGIAIAGKTGTAQFREHGKKRNLAWFTCFAPAYDPKVAVTVLVREQADNLNYYGGSHAAPIARKILLEYFRKNQP